MRNRISVPSESKTIISDPFLFFLRKQSFLQLVLGPRVLIIIFKHRIILSFSTFLSHCHLTWMAKSTRISGSPCSPLAIRHLFCICTSPHLPSGEREWLQWSRAEHMILLPLWACLLLDFMCYLTPTPVSRMSWEMVPHRNSPQLGDRSLCSWKEDFWSTRKSGGLGNIVSALGCYVWTLLYE